jgi:hypothetical protein
LVDFIYKKKVGRAWAKKSLLNKKRGLALGRWYSFERKLNALGREKICLI